MIEYVVKPDGWIQPVDEPENMAKLEQLVQEWYKINPLDAYDHAFLDPVIDAAKTKDEILNIKPAIMLLHQFGMISLDNNNGMQQAIQEFVDFIGYHSSPKMIDYFLRIFTEGFVRCWGEENKHPYLESFRIGVGPSYKITIIFKEEGPFEEVIQPAL